MDAARLTWKISVVGPKGVGKSSLISRIVYDSDSALGPQRALVKKKVAIDYENEKIMSDLLFQELDETDDVERLIPGSNVIIIVADLTENRSIAEAEEIIKFTENFEIRPLVVLVGTKLDRKYEAIIWEDDFNKLRKKYEVEYFIVSSKSSENIDEMMNYISGKLVENYYSKRKSNA